MIDVQFTLTEVEYLEAQTLFMSPASRRYRPWRVAAAVMFLAGLILLLYASHLTRGSIFPLWTLIFLIYPALLIFQKPLRQRALRKRFKREGTHVSNVHVILDARVSTPTSPA